MLRQRLIAGVGANALGKIWVLLGQLITVPMLLSLWGADGYGKWLMLTSISTYFALSDMGFGSAAPVAITGRVARNDLAGALAAFQSVWLFVTTTTFVVCVVGVAGIIVWNMWLTPPDVFSSSDIMGATLALLIYSFFAVQMSLLSVVFRSTKQYARGTLILDLLVPVETTALIAGAYIGLKFEGCAFLLLSIRTTGFFLYHEILRRRVHWFKLGWTNCSISEIRALSSPAMAALGMPFIMALSLQGVLFVVGIVAGPAAAGLFGAARTVTRLPLQFVGIVSRATLPELTTASSLGNRTHYLKLVTLNLAFLIAVIVPSLILAPFSAAILNMLPHKWPAINPSLIFALTIDMAFQAVWNTIAVFVFAENKQQKFVPVVLVLSVVGLASPIFFDKSICALGTAAVQSFLDLITIGIVISVWKSSSPFFEDTDPFETIKSFILENVRIPKFLPRRGF